MLEIERKFLVREAGWETPLSSRRIMQGYVFIGEDRNLRVRRSGGSYLLTLKVRSEGISRHEIEFPVDARKGRFILDELCINHVIEKTRHVVEYEGKTWEVDEFEGANSGLTVAEIELSAPDEDFSRPPWLGPEVTDDERFFNACLSERPFGSWGVTYRELLAEKGAS